MDSVCRICRGDESDGKLYHPCLCSGSIKYVHEDCLSEWLQHSHKQSKCELCGYTYSFENSYKKTMPSRLPLHLFIWYAAHKTWLLSRIVGALVALALIIKYSFEIATFLVRFDWSSWLFRRRSQELSNSLIRSLLEPRRPYFAWTTLPNTWASHTIVWTLWTQFVDGILLMMALIVFLGIVWLVAAWVTTDERLLHDLGHIALGEPGHIDLGDIEGDYLVAAPGENEGMPQHVDRPQADNPEQDDRQDEAESDSEDRRDEPRDEPMAAHRGVEIEHLADAMFDANQNVELVDDGVRVQPAPEAVPELDPPFDIDINADQEEEEEEEAEVAEMDLEDDMQGWDVEAWFFLSDILNAPTATMIREFLGLVLIAEAVIASLYFFPYLSGWLSLRTLTAGSSWLSVDKLPASIPVHLGLPIAYTGVLITILRALELWGLNNLLKSPEGRTVVGNFLKLFVIVKALVVLLVELLVFPELCGTLIVRALTPLLTDGQSLTFPHPAAMLVTQWVLGWVFMYFLNRLVHAARKTFRPGALYFAQDTSDPEFEILHIIVTQPLNVQIQRMAISAAIYAVIVSTLVSATVRILKFVPYLRPLQLDVWSGSSIIRAWPALIPPQMFWANRRLVKSAIGRWWRVIVWRRTLIRAARRLDLGSWLLGDRASTHAPGGSWVRAPGSDSWPFQRNMKLFVPVTEHNQRLDEGNGVHTDELETYTVVYRPPRFWLRVYAMCAVVWLRMVLVMIEVVLCCLVVGRLTDWALCGNMLRNDLFRFILGILLCSGAMTLYRSPHLVLDEAKFNMSQLYIAALKALGALGLSLFCGPTGHKFVDIPLLVGAIWCYPSIFNSLTFDLFSLLMLKLRPGPASILQWLAVTPQLVRVAVHWYRRFKVGERLSAWHQIIRDTYYLEGIRLRNYT